MAPLGGNVIDFGIEFRSLGGEGLDEGWSRMNIYWRAQVDCGLSSNHSDEKGVGSPVGLLTARTHGVLHHSILPYTDRDLG